MRRRAGGKGADNELRLTTYSEPDSEAGTGVESTTATAAWDPEETPLKKTGVRTKPLGTAGCACTCSGGGVLAHVEEDVADGATRTKNKAAWSALVGG